MAPFDPYHKWLAIPPEEQPPNHYRLLGLPVFESDAEVIEGAAERQTIYLRTFQTADNAELAEQLLNEVSEARVCLLNEENKVNYDQQLRGVLEPAPEVVPPGFTAEELGTVAWTPAARKPARRSRAQKPFWQEPWAIPVGAAGIVVVVCLLVWLNSGGQDSQLAEQPTGPAAAKVDREPKVPNNQDAEASDKTVDEERQAELKRLAEEKVERDRKVAAEKAVAEEKAAAEKGATETSPPPNKPDETPLEPAVVSVERLARVPFTIEADPTLLPPALQGATTWRYPEPKSDSPVNGVLRFKVIESGEVFLVANWKYQGNRSGGWYEERLTREQLVERGWKDLGPCVWDREVYLLKRQVKKGDSYEIRTNKYWPPDLVVRGKSDRPDPQTRVISGLGDRLDGKRVAAIRIFDLKMAKYQPFEMIPQTKGGEKQQPGWNKVPLVLKQNYVHSSTVPYRGIIQFDILEPGVVLAAVTAHHWGDQGLSGGEWQKTVQSREQLTKLGWQPVDPLPDGGLAEWSFPVNRQLIYRECKKGEVLHLRTKKYSTPVIIIPAKAIPKGQSAGVPTTTPQPARPATFATIALEKETRIAPLRKGVLAHHGDRYSWGEIPEFLRGFAVTQYEKHKGVSAIRVLRPGTVWMAVSPRWGGGGSSSGGWKDEVISQEDYLKMGWQEIGSITHHHNSEDIVLRWTIYQRKCAANESFQFRTEKYLAPVYFFPPGMSGVLNRN